MMGYPESYKKIAADEDSIKVAREAKESLGLTWNRFLEKAADELDSDH